MDAFLRFFIFLFWVQFLFSEQKVGFKIEKIEGRYWLVKPSGQPIFTHGITHASNQYAQLDYQKFSEACKSVGFNSYGYGCPEPLRKDMPFIDSWNHLVQISYYRGKNGVQFLDVFDPKVQKKLEYGVKAKCLSSRENPNTIGYCWTDLGSWALENPSGKNWVKFIRQLPQNAPGQKAYQNFITTWEGTSEKQRDLAFLRIIAKEYFKVVGNAQRKYAPNHLVFGERFGISSLSIYRTIVPEVLEEMLPYVDAIAIQPPFQSKFPKEDFDNIFQLTQKPILICDFAIRFKDENKDIRSWKPENDSIAAGKEYVQYIKDAFETDYIIGSFWCNPVDTPKGFSKPGIKQGFFGVGLTERPGLHQQVQELNRHIVASTPKTILTKDANLEKLASGYGTVEGPLYDGKDHLLFTDIPNHRIWKLNLKTLNTSLFMDDTGGANGLAFDLTGRLLMCKQLKKSLTRLEEDGMETVLLKPTRIGGNKKIYPVGVNDVVVDRKGRIYVTVPGAGSIYLLNSDGKNPRQVISGLKGPNGLMLSPEEKTLYVSEYKEQKIYAFDVDPKTGNPSNQRLFTQVKIPSKYGCDGMTVDQLGNIYCAGPYAVRVWNPQGKLLETIAVPESPTNCTFAGSGSNVLYITGRKNVFRIRLKTKGVR